MALSKLIIKKILDKAFTTVLRIVLLTIQISVVLICQTLKLVAKRANVRLSLN